MQLLTVSRKA